MIQSLITPKKLNPDNFSLILYDLAVVLETLVFYGGERKAISIEKINRGEKKTLTHTQLQIRGMDVGHCRRVLTEIEPKAHWIHWKWNFTCM